MHKLSSRPQVRDCQERPLFRKKCVAGCGHLLDFVCTNKRLRQTTQFNQNWADLKNNHKIRFEVYLPPNMTLWQVLTMKQVKNV